VFGSSGELRLMGRKNIDGASEAPLISADTTIIISKVTFSRSSG
jgi:hypothetical protein